MSISPYDDLMWRKKNFPEDFHQKQLVWHLQQFSEQEEEMGRTRSMFWDEDREKAVNDLVLSKRSQGFYEGKDDSY